MSLSNTRTPRRLAHRIAATATAGVLALSLTACGGGDEDDEDDEPRGDRSSQTPDDPDGTDSTDGQSGQAGGSGTLDDAQVEAAVLTLENFESGWTRTAHNDDDDDDDDAPGCLADIAAVTEDLDHSAKSNATYEAQEGLPQVVSQVSSYADEALVADRFDGVESAIEACTSVSYDDDGSHVELTLTPTTDLPLEADDQNGFVAGGTLTTSSGQSAQLYIHATFVRVGPTVATVTTTTIGEPSPSAHAAWAVAAAERLNAVVAGQDPAATVVPTA